MLIRPPSSTNILVPPLRQAFLLTGKVSSSDRPPYFRRSKIMYTVISLLIEAGGSASSAAFS